ncbi:MAG: 16S rRNA (adenine(1518)-N(6)/adenine(1519)-N(6))-dimethyltransferase RsmA [Gammaproteobacteria bacterium]
MNHQPRKRFGQNFLHDAGVLQRMLNAIRPKQQDAMVEIGPGEGALTTLLLQHLRQLDVIEIDRDLAPELLGRCQSKAGEATLGKLTIHQADALQFDFSSLIPAQGTLRVVGNLPYNISTPLLFHIFEYADSIKDCHFLLQKEVVERMAAAPNSKTYGRLSVMTQWRCQVEPLFKVGPGAFRPAPKVDSMFVRLIPHLTPPWPVDDFQQFSALVSLAFAQRRKTLRNALQSMASTETMAAAGIDPSARAETLSPALFAHLSNAIARSV